MDGSHCQKIPFAGQTSCCHPTFFLSAEACFEEAAEKVEGEGEGRRRKKEGEVLMQQGFQVLVLFKRSPAPTTLQLAA